MGFGNNKFNKPQQQQNSYRPAVKTGTTAATAESTSDKIILTGLYEYTKKDGTASKLVMRGKTNKEITIPAGYELKVFVAGGKSKNGKDLPPYQLVAQPARAAASKN